MITAVKKAEDYNCKIVLLCFDMQGIVAEHMSQMFPNDTEIESVKAINLIKHETGVLNYVNENSVDLTIAPWSIKTMLVTISCNV